MKDYLTKLKNIFAFRNIKGLVYLLLFLVITFIYSLSKEKYILLAVVFFLLLIFFIYNKTLFYYSVILIVYISIIIISKNIIYNKEESYIDDYYKVYKVDTFDDYDKVYIKLKNNKFIFNTNKYDLNAGDIIYIKGTVNKGSLAHYENGFNYYEYLKYQNIKGIIKVEELTIVDHRFSLNQFHEKVNDYISNKYKKENAQIIKALLIGNKNNLDEELSNNIKSIGISHLFVISGLHIDLISKTIEKGLSLFKLNNKLKNYIILLILFFYYLLTSFLVSILRVIISMILNKIIINKIKELTMFDKLFLNACIVLFINPFYLFSYSFILSYMIVFGILLISKKLKKDKTFKCFIFNNILISVISTLISLPIIVNISSDINILSIIFNLFFIPFVSYILLPFSFLLFVIPKLEFIYHYVVKFFIFITKYLSTIKLFTLTFSYLNLVLIIIFYVLIILILINREFKMKNLLKIMFVFYLLFLYLLPNINPSSYVSFIDLPVGDAALIHTKFNKSNILIDTGDIDASNLISYLKSKGIKRIDGIIISHGDSDHIGGLNSLIKTFNIKNIYLNYYDKESIQKIRDYNLQKTNIFYLKKGDEFYIDDVYFKVLWPSSNQFDINNNSLVIYTVIFNLTVLFTGDVESEAESKLVKEIGEINVDILKLAHHGSKTSSTKEFLKSIKFKYAVAMNGYNNTFGFPHKVVIDRINSINNTYLFNTIDFGTVTFHISKRRKIVKISTSFTN